MVYHLHQLGDAHARRELNVPDKPKLLSLEIWRVPQLVWPRWLRCPMRHIITQQSPATIPLSPHCGRSLIILPWLIILRAHRRTWCIAHCHKTGKIFILLVLLSVCAAREGWCIIQRGSTDAMDGSVQQNTLCLKVKYDVDWYCGVFTWKCAIGLNEREHLLSKVG